MTETASAEHPSSAEHPPFSAVPDAPASHDLELIARLAQALEEVGFRGESIAALLGEAAAEALARDQAAPALLVLESLRAQSAPESPEARLGAVVELFLLARPIPEVALERALPAVAPRELAELGLIEVSGQDVLSRVDLDVHDAGDLHLVVASDLTGFQRPEAALRPDHVLGIGGASQTLVQITDPRPVGRALDLGTGCGIQSFHLLRRAEHVVATDLSERALAFARFNLVLNAEALGLDPQDLEARIELRQGSLLEPVAGERFDLVATNPPFVITPRTAQEDDGQRYTYRDGGRSGDDLVRELISSLDQVLAPGGSAHLLANWEIPAGEQPLERSWSQRVRSWIPQELDAWVIQRETESPEAYAETWLRDASQHLDRARYEAAYADYLRDFASRDTAGIGFGWLRLDRPDSAPGARGPRRRVESLPHPVQQPVGAVLAEAIARQELLDRLGPDWTELRLIVPEHVTEERHQRPGAEDPSVILLRQGAGLQRTSVLTSATAGLVGACDGELSVAQIVGALAALLDWEPGADGGPSAEAAAVLEEVRRLLIDDFLEIDPDPAAEAPEVRG